MLFNENSPYKYTPMDREYIQNVDADQPVGGYGATTDLERPILSTGQIGQTVTEGRAGGGTFIETVQRAIWQGASSVELSTQMEGAEPGTGAALYGVDKRRELREIARANEVKISSVHTPTQVGNLSGFAGPERGFVDEQREVFLNEVKKAIDFAADVSDGAAVVVHTGEFQRPMSEQTWAKDEHGRYVFKHYEDEPDKAIMRLVDDRTGQVITSVRKNQEVYRPIWKQAEHDYTYTDDVTGQTIQVHKGDFIDYEDKKVARDRRVPEWDREQGRFKVKKMVWQDFVKEAEDYNKENAERHTTPEEAFLRATIETQAGQARGWALYHAQNFNLHKDSLEKLKQVREFYLKLDKNLPEEEKWKIMKQDPYYRGVVSMFLPPEVKHPLEIIDREIRELRHNIEHTRESTISYEQQAKEQDLIMDHAVPIADYAKKQSMRSYAEAGVYAMDLTMNKGLSKPVFVAPEQVFPEHGYGSHPDEMIELVHNARKAMAEKLVHERGYSEDKAKNLAEKHIKATLDTEHLGMWKRYFQKKPNENEEQFTERFNKWYMDKVKEMDKAGIIGHLHIADGFGYGHGNLPAGHGTMPVVDAVTYLKKKGYTGAYLSEGYGDVTRMLRDTWKAFGSPIYGAMGPVRPGAPTRWSDVQHSYFGQNQPPYYVFGAYSPSNDWTLWSQTPME